MLDPTAQSARDLIDAFLDRLDQIPEDAADKAGEVVRLHRELRESMVEAGLDEGQIGLVTSYNHLLYEQELKKLTFRNHAVLPMVLHAQLMAEHFIRRYLTARFPDFPWKAMNLTFARAAHLASRLLPDDEFHKTFMAGLRDVAEIRNSFVHDLDFEIEAKHTARIVRFYAANQDLYKTKNFAGPLDEYCEFCYAVCAYFDGFARPLEAQRKHT